MAAERARLTDDQVVGLAALERAHGSSRAIPLGPRRDRMLKAAVTYGAIVVALSEVSSCTCCCPFAIVEYDGRVTIFEPT
jgi:hypothetical protein